MVVVAGSALIFGLIAGYQRALRQARQSARTSHCLNNLKQIGLAIESYRQNPYVQTGNFAAYPPGTIPNPALPLERRVGWATLIYRDDTEGCSGCPSISPWLGWDDPSQEHGATFEANKMYCPGCPYPTAARKLVPASYIAIAGLGTDAPGLPKQHPRAGIFGDDRTTSPADVRDGLANTLMIVESLEPAGPWFAGGRQTVRGLDPLRQPYLGPGRQFGGIHDGRTNVLMADGSVRSFRDAIDPKVFEALSTMSGGEKVSVP